MWPAGSGVRVDADDPAGKRDLGRKAKLKNETSHDSIVRFRFGSLLIDVAARAVTVDGRSVHLTWGEFDLLWYLAMNSGRAVSRDELFSRLVGVEYNGLDRTIDLRVSRLRKKLESVPGTPPIIQSVRSEGYCLIVSQES